MGLSKWLSWGEENEKNVHEQRCFWSLPVDTESLIESAIVWGGEHVKLPACSARVSAIRNLPRRIFVDDVGDVVVDDDDNDDNNDEDWGSSDDDKDIFYYGRRQKNLCFFSTAGAIVVITV